MFDMLKLNCECCEYEVLNGHPWVLDRKFVKRFTGEIHGCRHGKYAELMRKGVELLRARRGCNFPPQNFDEDGTFVHTANLNDVCTVDNERAVFGVADRPGAE